MTGEYCRNSRAHARTHSHTDAAEGLKPSSAEVAGSRSSAGSAGDMNSFRAKATSGDGDNGLAPCWGASSSPSGERGLHQEHKTHASSCH